MIDDEVRREGVAWGRSAAETAARHVDRRQLSESRASVMRALEATLVASIQFFLQNNGAPIAQIWEEAAVAGIRAVFPDFRQERATDARPGRPNRLN